MRHLWKKVAASGATMMMATTLVLTTVSAASAAPSTTLSASSAPATASPSSAATLSTPFATNIVPVDFPGGPRLWGGDCTIWAQTNGTVRWGPRSDVDTLLMTSYDYSSKRWIERSLDPTAGSVEKLETPGEKTYFFQWVVDGKRSDISQLTFKKSTFRCNSTVQNASTGVSVLPLSDQPTVQKVQRVNNKTEVTLLKNQFLAKNRFIIKIDNQYAAETYNGWHYYSSKRDNGDGTITITDDSTLDNNKHMVDVYTVPDEPGTNDGNGRMLNRTYI